METIEKEAQSVSSGGAKSFVKHVFNFDDDSKNEMMNIVQYSLLAIIPIVVLNKCIQRYIPDVDESKGSLEIFIEVCGQIIVMFIGILLIHRIITFVPTYSKSKYAEFSVTNIILAFLVIVLSLQTKLGEKVNLLLERILEVVEGKVNIKEGQSNNPSVSVSQPISNSGYIDNANYNPNNPPVNQGVQQSPDFQQMYSGPTTPLQNASTPSMNNTNITLENFESPLMAANEVLGGGFGSAF